MKIFNQLSVIVINSLLIHSSCMAFEYSVHGEITTLAQKVIQKCNQENKLSQVSITKDQISLIPKISQGTVEEDTTQQFFRGSNWHFYNTYGNLRSGLLNESLDNAFSVRNDELVKNLDSNSKDETLNTLGRILHYIQDMFVPAHVVPVFHGKPFAKDDEFDHYEKSSKDLEDVVNSISCEQVNQKLTTIKNTKNTHILFDLNRSILDASAKFTYSQIRTPIAQSTTSWGYFWRDPLSKSFNLFDTPAALVAAGVQAKRFGTYVGEFGKDKEIKDINGKVIIITPNEYKKFYLNQYREAVLTSSAFMIHHLQTQLK